MRIKTPYLNNLKNIVPNAMICTGNKRWSTTFNSWNNEIII